jgi:hypothetical protein
MCPTSPREVAVKFAADRVFADPDKAARKLVELANAAEADRDQRIAIELINLPFLRTGGSVDEYRAGIERAIENGWLVRHESGTFVKFTQAGADLFAGWRADRPMGARPAFGTRDTGPCRPPDLEGTATRTINRDFSRSFQRHFNSANALATRA